MSVSIDTNVLVYAADPRDPSKQQEAREVIRRTALVPGALSEQCLFEFVSVTMRRLNVPRDLSVAILRQWLLILDVIVPPNDIFDRAVALMRNYNLSGWDARLLATCDSAGIGLLLSEDLQDGGRYGGVTVINPFNAANSIFLKTVLPP